MTSKNKWPDRFPLFLLVGLWALLHYRVLFMGHTFVLMDCSRFFYPLWKWGSTAMKGGVLPLWNPDASFGTPFAADPQTLCWYPPKVLFYQLLDPTTAFTGLLLLHHLWALAGMWVLGRGRGFGPAAVLLGCLITGFSFNALSLTWAPVMFFTFSWIPWVFHLADGLWEKGPGSFLKLSIAVSMQMAAGYPPFAYLTALMILGEWMTRVWPDHGEKIPRGEWTRKFLHLAGAFFLAALFNATWLLPFFEFIPYTNLSLRLGMPEALGAQNLTTWLNPFFLGHPLFSHPETPFSVTVFFIGLPTLVLLLWGSVKRMIGRRVFLLFGIALILSLGESLEVGGWLKIILPGYRWVVRSGYWIPLVVFFAALAAMEAFEKLIAFSERRHRLNWTWIALTVAVYGAALALGVPWTLASFWLSLGMAVVSGATWKLPLGWRKALFILSLVFSLGPVLRSVHFTMGRDYYNQPPRLLNRLAAPGRIYHSPSAEESYQTVSGNGAAEIYEKLKEAMAPNWPLGLGLQETAYPNAFFLKSFLPWYYAPEKNRLSRKILGYLNCRYVMEEGSLWENPEILPKWFSVKAAVHEMDWDADLKRAIGSDFHFTRVCFEEDPTKTGPYFPRQVQELERTPNSVTLQANGHGEALLVSSETAYPGWKAEVNGSLRPLEGVNHGFRGVLLANGEERAKIEYRPGSFRLGLFLSLLACGLWAGVILNLGLKPKYARI